MRATYPAYLTLLDTIILVSPIFCKKYKFRNSFMIFTTPLLYSATLRHQVEYRRNMLTDLERFLYFHQRFKL